MMFDVFLMMIDFCQFSKAQDVKNGHLANWYFLFKSIIKKCKKSPRCTAYWKAYYKKIKQQPHSPLTKLD